MNELENEKNPLKYAVRYMALNKPEDARPPKTVWQEWFENNQNPPFDDADRSIIKQRIDAEMSIGRLPPETTIESYIRILRTHVPQLDRERLERFFAEIEKAQDNLVPETKVGNEILLDFMDFANLQESDLNEKLCNPRENFEFEALADLAYKESTLVNTKELPGYREKP